MGTENALIELRNVYKIYGSEGGAVHALDGVNLSIRQGEFVAIVGNSGSGKSTLMNMIGCLDVPSSGIFRLDGVEVSGLTDDELSQIRNRQIGFIFQGFNLIPSMDALENVELPLYYRGMPREERRVLALEALRQVGLLSRKNHLPGQMSGGQQQRVAIARAIAAKPPILLADEPTGNLDSNSSKEVMQVLHGLWKDGKTVVLITHDSAIAAEADRMIRVHDGKILPTRPVRDVS